MTRPVRFTLAEMERAAVIARKEGVTVRLDREGNIEFAPAIHKAEPEPKVDRSAEIRL